MGLSPSASFSEQGPRLYEPIHGSAPDIANQDIANPFGMLLSVAMCLRESLNEDKAADKLENVIYQLIKEGKQPVISMVIILHQKFLITSKKIFKKEEMSYG